jgi:rhodanese-related sulfurtransferase
MFRKGLLITLVILGLGAFTGWNHRVDILDSLCGTTPPAPTAQIQEALEQGAMLLDVRMYVETRKQDADLLTGAENIPLLRLASHMDALPRDRTLITFCVSGKRAGKAADMLRARDFKALSGGGIANVREILKTIEPSPRSRPEGPPLERPTEEATTTQPGVES